MVLGVERRTLWIDLLHAVALERAEQLLQGHLHAVGERLGHALGRSTGGLQAQLQRIGDAEEIPQHVLRRELARLGRFVLGAADAVLGLGGGTQLGVAGGGDGCLRVHQLGLHGIEFGLERLGRVREGRVGRFRRLGGVGHRRSGQ